MKRNIIIELIGVTILSGSLMAGCTLLPPVHQDVLSPDKKDSNESNAQINTTTNNIDIDITTPVDNPVEPDIIEPDNNNVIEPDNNNVDNGNNGFTADYSATEDDYLKFLNGEIDAMVTYLNTDYLEFEKTYTYDSMIEEINAKVEEEWMDERKVQEVDYAIIDCGNDGYPEMALYMAIDNGNYDTLQEYYIFKFYNGNLCIVDSYNAYYRSMGELNIFGVFTQYGSSGANRGYASYVRCNKDGVHEFIYSLSNEQEIGEATIAGYYIPSYIDLPEDYPLTHDTAGKYTCNAYSFMEYDYTMDGDDDYYNEYLDQFVFVFTDRQGGVVYPEAEYMKIYDQCGFVVTDFEGLNERVAERLEELGMTDEELLNSYTENYVVPDWIVWEDNYEH